MKSLKLDSDELHHRFKRCCVESQTTMIDAVRQMVTQWCEDVERRKPVLRSAEQTKETPAIRPKPGKPSRRHELDANGQQEIPIAAQTPGDSTTRALAELKKI